MANMVVVVVVLVFMTLSGIQFYAFLFCFFDV